MIMEQNAAHKVAAISTSEDSQEGQKPTDYRSEQVIQNERHNGDESRDIGEIRRMLQKPLADRDDSNPSSSDNEESTPNNVAIASASRDRVDAMSVHPFDDDQPQKSSASTKKTLPHHSLLPSLSTSFDPVVDDQQWSHSFNPNGEAGMKKSPKPKHRRSPATTFPHLHSPKSNHHQSECADDEASFNLFNQSFDTMSDTANYLRDLNTFNQPDVHRGNGERLSPNMLGFHRHDSSHNMDLSLPALGQYVNADVSPMHSYSEGGGHFRSMSGMDPIPVHFPQDEEAAAAAAQAHGYYGHAGYFDHAEATPTTNFYGGSLVSNPLFVLRCARHAFSNCTFLFSCLKNSDPCAVNISENGSFQHMQARDNQAYREPMDPHELTIASRRVGAAICAFGGSIKPKHVPIPMTSSIFRPKDILTGDSTNNGELVSFQAYEERLRNRYQMNSTHISWDVEENPPVDSVDANQTRNDILAHMNTNESHSPMARKSESESSSGKDASIDMLSPYSSVVEMTSNGTKMKYRCKLCGQPKQNHSCPYRHSMQRSIGITVHPAVNSFTAHEPGALAVPLSEMNNFVSYDSDHGSSESTRLMSTNQGIEKHPCSHESITPETFGPEVPRSPQSSVSPHASSLETVVPVGDTSDKSGVDTGRKRSHSEMAMDKEVNHDVSRPFIEEIQLRPEQYRAVTDSKQATAAGGYQYPTIDLTFTERSRLSDTLFVLSRSVPHLTEECSTMLNDARTKDSWDLAVAELLTQLVVGTYCQEGDRCLDGLQQYLLSLGIAC